MIGYPVNAKMEISPNNKLIFQASSCSDNLATEAYEANDNKVDYSRNHVFQPMPAAKSTHLTSFLIYEELHVEKTSESLSDKVYKTFRVCHHDYMITFP